MVQAQPIIKFVETIDDEWHRWATMTYSITRFFENGSRESIATGLSLEEAQTHCKDPQTSSRTASESWAVALTAERGRWFDGYESEDNFI
jgi:hypothetical protein